MSPSSDRRASVSPGTRQREEKGPPMRPAGDRPATSRARVSVVIPTLNEEEALGRHLAAAVSTAGETIVSDGGSSDRTLDLAAAHGARIVDGPPGRGGQLNRGAEASGAEILLFLHADTRLPDRAADLVCGAVDEGAVGGGFQVRFDIDSPIYRFGARVVNLRTRLRRKPLGDQAQFVTRRAFEAVGGFRDWPVLEDLEFIGRLGKHGRLAIMPAAVTTSSRRFAQRGPVRTVITNWLIWALYGMGVSAHRLARLYRLVR